MVKLKDLNIEGCLRVILTFYLMGIYLFNIDKLYLCYETYNYCSWNCQNPILYMTTFGLTILFVGLYIFDLFDVICLKWE